SPGRVAPGDDAAAAARADHDARAALYTIDERAVPAGAGPHPLPDRGRDPRADGIQARRAPGALARAAAGAREGARGRRRPTSPANRVLGDGEPDRVGARVPDRR